MDDPVSARADLPAPVSVVITDVRIPFATLVRLFIFAFFAMIPALLAIGALLGVFYAMLLSGAWISRGI